MQPEGTHIVDKSFCQCITPEWMPVKGIEGICEKARVPVDVPKCEFELFNQIKEMDIYSECGINTDSTNGAVSITDTITYGWEHVKDIELPEECKEQIKTKLMFAKDCNKYVSFSSAFPGK